MTHDRLSRLLLRLAIAFVGLQIAALVVVLAVLALLALGIEGADLPVLAIAEPPR
jgi:hypothetical protein